MHSKVMRKNTTIMISTATTLENHGRLFCCCLVRSFSSWCMPFNSEGKCHVIIIKEAKDETIIFFINLTSYVHEII